MLSYQHSYHAGNLADVHKHALMAAMLDYMTRKDKPLSYLETHSGRGLYALDAAEAVKTGEAAQGIERIARLNWFAPDHPYARALAAVRAAHGARAYPGSPLLAATLLRPIDSIQLCELHPQEFAALRAAMESHGGVFHQKDGLQMALALAPPTPRRGVILIDPSWEVKSDYEAIPKLIGQVARKWNVGVIALWYPILAPSVTASDAQRAMVRGLRASHPEALISEVRFPPAREGHGMIGSGMFVLNPPWGLEDEAQRLGRLFAKL
ncbi:23S rRNA (adenine(2030)-N(6))-methyltransferase RlmJ [Sedimentimonas flavescens]|uniref:23S rRNA (adenine(2030)-N(6))-methyltransferase RlmJ n=1 Tax=Sedimentimonas flavescens TaxID=2851012 RepID=UPI001C49EA71|nr:23S rRNA (adenine(2030)-N(6))-methyltransferase RlmJ [Sedimentimonas flavescens]MBW0158813.1 23S rRNA (adenine(2030)-N(6))-methyltransferase RlmJ [Sedimentimonas flavescens]